jgi:hypothetical protein
VLEDRELFSLVLDDLEEHKTRRGERPSGRLIAKPVDSGFVWNKTSESRCSYAAACLQVSVRMLNGMGGSSPRGLKAARIGQTPERADVLNLAAG